MSGLSGFWRPDFLWTPCVFIFTHNLLFSSSGSDEKWSKWLKMWIPGRSLLIIHQQFQNIHSVFPPGSRGGQTLGKFCWGGGVQFLKAGGGILNWGNPNFWCFTRSPSGGMPSQSPKMFFEYLWNDLSPFSF